MLPRVHSRAYRTIHDIVARRPSEYFTITELARLTGLSRFFVRKVCFRLAKYGYVWIIQVGRKLYISKYLHKELAEHPNVRIIDGPVGLPFGWAREVEGQQPSTREARNPDEIRVGDRSEARHPDVEQAQSMGEENR